MVVSLSGFCQQGFLWMSCCLGLGLSTTVGWLFVQSSFCLFLVELESG